MPGGGNSLIVLPTGGGKSLVIASLASDAVQKYRGRVVVLQHRQELIEQNADKIRRLCDVPVGLYSAGLNRKQINEDIVVGGIQSIYRKAADLGRRHMVIIDEVHLTPPDGDGMYRTFLDTLGGLNPKLKIVGLTATPYRTDSGSIVGEGSLFPRITYEAKIPRLISEGYLCPVVSDPGLVDFDTSKLTSRSSLKDLELVFDSNAEKTRRAVSEIIARANGRHSAIIFCSGVDHSRHVAAEIQRQTGQECGCVVGDTLPIERAAILERFRNQQLRWLTNCAVLTTGFDAPCIDLIAILRWTDSPGLLAQICGRGLRTDRSKENCLILDFGQNIKRFGPIDAIDFNERNTKRGNGNQDAPMKRCPGCRQEVHAAARVCECGFQFPKPELRHDEVPDGSKILSEPEIFEVISQSCNVHRKRNDPDALPTLRVDYLVRPINADGDDDLIEDTISEWICIEHPPGFARTKAALWWAARSVDPMPNSCEDAERLFDQWKVAQSRTITARREGKWWRIIKHELIELEEIEQVDQWGVDDDLPF